MFTETQMEPKGTRPGLTAMKLKNKIFLGLLALGSVAFFANCRHHSIEDPNTHTLKTKYVDP
jgi:hypothetical protein